MNEKSKELWRSIPNINPHDNVEPERDNPGKIPAQDWKTPIKNAFNGVIWYFLECEKFFADNIPKNNNILVAIRDNPTTIIFPELDKYDANFFKFPIPGIGINKNARGTNAQNKLISRFSSLVFFFLDNIFDGNENIDLNNLIKVSL